jgi:hypothetical protein
MIATFLAVMDQFNINVALPQTSFDAQARTRAFSTFGAAVGPAALCGQVLGSTPRQQQSGFFRRHLPFEETTNRAPLDRRRIYGSGQW